MVSGRLDGAAPFQHAVAGRVRRSRPRPGRGRDLRRHRLHRHTTHARNGNPDRARRAWRRYPSARLHQFNGDDDRRHCHRSRRGVRADSPVAEHALPGHRDRSIGVRDHPAVAVRGRDNRHLHPGAPRDEGQSDHRLTRTLIMDTLLQDIRFGIRMLFKSPGFTAVAIISLALGIGANTAVFSVVNAALLKTLPYQNPESLVLVWGEDKAAGSSRGQVSATDVADFRARNQVFEEISTYSDFRPVLTGVGEPERIFGAQVGDGFFDVMQVKPLLGRFFTPEEQVDGKDYVAVLTYALWQKRLAGDPNIVGKTITLSARPYTVIGVLPANFHSLPRGLLPAPAEFYRPVAEQPNDKERGSRHLRAIARLKPGVTVTRAQAEMDLIARQLQSEHPDSDANAGVHLVNLREDLVSPVRPALIMLLGAVVFLLLIACANVGNLLLARSIGRYREVAIRAAVGASRGRLIRQFMTESVLVAAAGGALGVLTAMWCTSAIEALGSRLVPMLGTIEIDGGVLAFAFVLSMITGVAFGLAPALRAWRV